MRDDTSVTIRQYADGMLADGPGPEQHDPTRDLGRRLKAARARKRMTQQEAANALGETKSNYSKREQGKRGMSADFINKACEIFGVTPDEILSELREDSDHASGQLIEIDQDALAKLIVPLKEHIAALTPEKARELLLALFQAARKS